MEMAPQENSSTRLDEDGNLGEVPRTEELGELTEGKFEDDGDERHCEQFEEIENLNEVTYDLTVWNLAAFTFQFISAVPLFWLASDSEANWFIYTNFPNAEFDDPEEEGYGVPSPKRIANFSLTWYSAVFILLSGIYHLSVTLPCCAETYEYYLARHQNPFRWLEYSFSAALMRIMIAQLVGITDLHIIICIFTMATTTMVLGGCHESMNAKARADGYEQNWCVYLAAWIPQIGTWTVIIWYFANTVGNGNGSAKIWTTVILQFALDTSFAVLFHLQWTKAWIFEDYMNGEKMFIVLSFVSKALLAWINIGVSTK